MCAILMSLYADERMGKIAGAQLSERKWIYILRYDTPLQPPHITTECKWYGFGILVLVDFV